MECYINSDSYICELLIGRNFLLSCTTNKETMVIDYINRNIDTINNKISIGKRCNATSVKITEEFFIQLKNLFSEKLKFTL